MTPLERYAAAENAALKEVMRDNRGVEGLRTHQMTKGISTAQRITQRAKQTCAACGVICRPDGVYHYRGERVCSAACVDDIRRWVAWTKSSVA